MKARIEGGKIIKYASIPNKIDNILGGAKNLDPQSLGFYDIIVPNYDPTTQAIHNLHFDSAYENDLGETQEVFIYDVKYKELDDIATLKSNKIAELKSLANAKLQPTDWYVIREASKGFSIPSNITTSRDAILSTVNTKESEINSLNTQKSVIEYDINF
jgi:hypothetical protein